MSGQFGQVVFIVWRESVEALLIIGIIHAWLSHQGGDTARRGKLFLLMGGFTGLVMAGLLAMGILLFSQYLSDEMLEYFQASMVFIAAALIVQMVYWLRRQGRFLKKNLEANLSSSIKQANWWGIFTLTALAIAREGSETVIFLYGVLATGSSSDLMIILSIVAGFAVAIFTYLLIQFGQCYISWRFFFRLTEIVLLFLGASLVINGVDHLVSLGIIDFDTPILWDSFAILDDSKVWGNFIASLTGYRARVDMIWLISYLSYWLLVFLLLCVDRLRTRRLASKYERPKSS